MVLTKEREVKLIEMFERIPEENWVEIERFIKGFEETKCVDGGKHDWKSIGYQGNGHQECKICNKQKPF